MMVQVTIDVDASGLENLSPDKITDAKRKGLDYASQEMVRVLQRNSPVDHGVLKSWFIDSITDDEATIHTPAKYAQIVNDGYDGYIYPGGKALVFVPSSKYNIPVQTKGKFKGKAVFTKVRGQKGQHFVEKSIDDVEGRLDGYFLKALSEVLG